MSGTCVVSAQGRTPSASCGLSLLAVSCRGLSLAHVGVLHCGFLRRNPLSAMATHRLCFCHAPRHCSSAVSIRKQPPSAIRRSHRTRKQALSLPVFLLVLKGSTYMPSLISTTTTPLPLSRCVVNKKRFWCSVTARMAKWSPGLQGFCTVLLWRARARLRRWR